MLTKKDREMLVEEFKEIFVTRKEFREEITALRHDMLQFKDDILWEIKAMREEFAILTGYRGTIENHEERIQRLEGGSPQAPVQIRAHV